MNECSEVEGYVEFYLLFEKIFKKKKTTSEAPNYCPQLWWSDLWALQERRSLTTGVSWIGIGWATLHEIMQRQSWKILGLVIFSSLSFTDGGTEAQNHCNRGRLCRKSMVEPNLFTPYPAALTTRISTASLKWGPEAHRLKSQADFCLCGNLHFYKRSISHSKLAIWL